MANGPAHGFVLHAQLTGLPEPQTFHRLRTGSVWRVSGRGLTIAVRHYPATPESLNEDHPLLTQTVVLTYEGRVDNRREVAYALGRPALAQWPDGAVLAAAYEAWGPTLSAKVIGEYAYALFDRRTRQVVAGQDSLAVRRIYYSRRDGQVWITSNLRLLFEQFPEARPPFDRDVLREYFAGVMTPWSGRTIWRGIRQLRHGGVLVQRNVDLEERTAWRPGTDRRGRLSDAEVDEAFRGLLFEAVGGALRCPGRVLCDLSGGFDSSTVCAIAALLTRSTSTTRRIVAWSCVNDRADERRFQDAVRTKYDLDSRVLEIWRYLPFQVFNDTEVPTGTFIQCGATDRAMREFARIRGIGCRVTGHGADVLMQKGLPAPVYLSEWLKAKRLRACARDFAAYVKGGSFSVWHLLRDCVLGSLDMHAGSFRSPLPDWLTARFREEIREANHDFLRSQRVFPSDARERVYRHTVYLMPHHGSMLPDERRPFSYRPLVEFILGLDWENLVRPDEDRVLMRRALHDLLPEPVRGGGSSSGHAAIVLEGLRVAWPRIAAVLKGGLLAELGVVERKPFQAALERMRAGYSGPNRQFSITALYLEAWLGFKAGSSAAHVDSAAGATA